ncbi:MAG: GNAT family N-acetyltransferase [Chlorobi bacterium]|nr:GNAT family N-acetyltransferase [Chlorobiota bacterium]
MGLRPRVIPYDASFKPEWDAAVDHSPESPFILTRDYMDYHRDRFRDASILVYDGGKLAGLVPAHREDDTVFAHRGLTFGGWLLTRRYAPERMFRLWESVLDFYRRQGAKRIRLTDIPPFFSGRSGDMKRLVYSRFGRAVRTRWFWIIDTRTDPETLLNKDRRRSIERAPRGEVVPSKNWEKFWNILESNLNERHGAKPVHTLDEIRLLASRFPENIRLFLYQYKNEILAGAVVYAYRHARHFQYLSARPDLAGNGRGAVDKLVWELIKAFYPRTPYVSLGTACREEGLHETLAYWKYSFGAVPVPQYEWEFRV